MPATHVSDRGAFYIASREALVPARYRDLVGVDTWGIGHTSAAGLPDPRAMSFAMPDSLIDVYEEAWNVFQSDLRAYSNEVLRIFGPLEQNELDGLTAWHFNTGGAWTSGGVKVWRAGDKMGAFDRYFTKWNKVTKGGRKIVNDHLTKRRAEEKAIALRGSYPSTQMPVYPTNGRGSVIWQPTEVFTYDDWMMFLGRTTSPYERVKDSVGNNGAIAGLIAAAIGFLVLASETIKGWF